MTVQSGRGPQPGAAKVGPVKGQTWVEVNLDAIAHNLAAVKKLVGPKVGIMAVVKANAYGHGALAVARTSLTSGAAALAVTTVEEGSELRRRGIRAPILVMGAILPQEAAAVIRQSLTPSVGSLAVAEALDDVSRQMHRKTRIHVKVDTGLGRLGVRSSEAPAFVQRLRELEWLEVEGIYSHFATAFQAGSGYARRQLAAFNDVVAKIEADGRRIPLKHMANSEAVITLPESRLDMVRVGNLMYGESPVPLPAGMELQPTWSWKARVVHLQTIAPGSGIGYGRDYVARREMVVAVLPVGQADGFRVSHLRRPTRLSELGRAVARDVLTYVRRNRVPAEVLVKGREAPVVGRVGMQTSTVDVSRIPGVEPGDVATLSGRRVNVPDHVPRIYVGAGAIAGQHEERQEHGERPVQERRREPERWEPHGDRTERVERRPAREDRPAREAAVAAPSRPELTAPPKPEIAAPAKPAFEPAPETAPVPEAPFKRPVERPIERPSERPIERPPGPSAVLQGERLSGLTTGGEAAGPSEDGEADVAPAKRPFGARKKKGLRGPKRRRHTPGKIRPS
ncbi:MAG: alanine racemase [Bacillota bacterium]